MPLQRPARPSDRGLKLRSEAIIVGNPEDHQTSVGPVINEAAIERFYKAVKAGRSKGRIVHGGERLAGGLLAKGNFVTPTVGGGTSLGSLD